MNQSYHIQCARGLLDKSHQCIGHLPILLFKHGNLLLTSNHVGIFLVLEEVLHVFNCISDSIATIRIKIGVFWCEIWGNVAESRSEYILEGFQWLKSTINCFHICGIVGNIYTDGTQIWRESFKPGIYRSMSRGCLMCNLKIGGLKRPWLVSITFSIRMDEWISEVWLINRGDDLLDQKSFQYRWQL